jgi:hypothetical protein
VLVSVPLPAVVGVDVKLSVSVKEYVKDPVAVSSSGFPSVMRELYEAYEPVGTPVCRMTCSVLEPV